MTEPAIRRAGPADAEALREIGARTFSDTFAHLYAPEDLAAFLADAHGLERIRADLANPAKALWLVEQAGRPVGYALAGPCDLPHPDVTPASGELKRIYLDKTCQGGGVGGRLFDATMAWLQQDGPRDVWIGVWSENYGAQRFYTRRGFEKVGEYGFVVGGQTDHEFILKKPAASFSHTRTSLTERGHNFA
jgi:ribosomal protein S18 acetylase RimI-like enzyme